MFSKTLWKKGIAACAIATLFLHSGMHTAFGLFQDVTGQPNDSDHTPGITDTDYYFAFTNTVEAVDGDKIQVEFAPEFTLDTNNSDLDIYSYAGIIDSTSNTVVDLGTNTITKTIDFYDGSYGVDAFEVYAYYIDNPVSSGVYPVTIRLLDSADQEKESGTFSVTIEQKMDYFYGYIDVQDNNTATPGATYYFEGLPTSNIVSGESLRFQFPPTTDLSSATLDFIEFTDFSTPETPTYDNFVVDNANKTITLRITSPADSAGKYFYVNFGNITSLESFGVHYVEGQILDSGGNVREVGSSNAGYLQSPADAANDFSNFYFTPTIALETGDKIQVDYPEEFQVFANSSDMNLNAYNSTFNNVENAVVDQVQKTLTSAFEIRNDSNGIDRISVEVSRITNPSVRGVYPVQLKVLSDTDAVKETFDFDVIVGEQFDYFFANTSSNQRGANGTTYSFEGQPATPVEDGQKIILHFPDTADISAAAISNVSYTNYTGSTTPAVVSGYVDNSIEITATSAAPSDGAISIEVTGVKNPIHWGDSAVYMEVRSAADAILGIGSSTVNMNAPQNSSFNDISLLTPLTGAENNTFFFEQFTPQVTIDDGYEMALHFPGTTDLSQVDAGDVQVINGGFTPAGITVNNTEKTVSFTASGTDDGNGVTITIQDVTNPTNSGEFPLYLEISSEGLLQETISGTASFETPGRVTLQQVNISTTRPNAVAEYRFTLRTPIRAKDDWTMEFDFDDTMDLTNWDFNNDFFIYSDNLDPLSPSDVTVDTVNNIFTVRFPYSSQNSSDEYTIEFYNLTNPTSSGLNDFTVTYKDSLGNVAGDATYTYYIADRVEVRPSTFDKGVQTDFRIGITPDFDVADGETLIVTFPEEFDLSNVSGMYFEGDFDASPENFGVDLVANEVYFDVDTDFASIPDSQGNEVRMVIQDVKNPLTGSATPYEVQVTHVYGGGPGGPIIIVDAPEMMDREVGMSVQSATLANATTDYGSLIAPVAPGGGIATYSGFVFYAPPAVLNPSVTLSNAQVSQNSTYFIDFTPSIGVDGGWVIRLVFPPDTDISNVITTSANVRLSGGASQQGLITKDNANRTIDIEVNCNSCSNGTGNSALSIEVDNVINATTAGNYTLDMAIEDNSSAGQMAGSGNYTLVGAGANSVPNAPVDPYVNTAATGAGAGNAGPTTLDSTSVVFTAEHSDNDGDAATHYEIEIYSSATLTLPNQVHSTGKTALGVPLADGARNAAPGFGTAATLTDGSTYYWRIRYYDDANNPGTPGNWSGANAFTIDTSAPTLTSSTPSNGATGIAPSPTFTYVLDDATSPIATGTVNVTVGGTPIVVNGVCQPAAATCSVTPTLGDSTEVTVSFTLATPLAYNTPTAVVITAEDNTGNGLVANPNFTIQNAPAVDVTPPAITAQNPGNGAAGVPISPNFSYTITDVDSDVDISTVQISVAGEQAIVNGACGVGYTCTTIPGADAPSVTFSFTRNTPLSNGQNVSVVINASDTAPGANTLNASTNFQTVPSLPPVLGGGGSAGSGGGGGFSPVSNDPAVTSPGRPSAPEEPSSPVEPGESPVTSPIEDTCQYFQEQVTAGDVAYGDIQDAMLTDYAAYLLENGIILGKSPTEFGPQELMTRAEVLRSLVQARCEKFTLRPVAQKPFPDVATSHPDAVYIDAAKRANIVNGYKSDGTYRPDRFITRAEALKVVVQEVLGEQIATFDGPINPFQDVSNNEWYVNYVRFGVATGLVEVSAEKLFYPNEPISREEITRLLAKTLQSREAILQRVDELTREGASKEEIAQVIGEEILEPRSSAPEVVVEEMPIVADGDIVKEPIEACMYFSARKVVPQYRDIDASVLGDFVAQLLAYGVVVGKNAQEFAPHERVSRSEILRIMIQASCGNFVLSPVLEKPFPDVPTNHRDAVFIQAAKEANIIRGYGDGTYRPDTSISNAEILKILLETTLGGVIANFDSAQDHPFGDVEDASWYARYVRFAAAYDLAVTTDGVTFKPDTEGDRGFIADTLLRMLLLRDTFTAQPR